MSYSQPSVARILNEAFVPVRMTMHLVGPGTDDAGRSFAVRHKPAGRSDMHPPDMFVAGPEGELLGSLRYDASAVETIEFFRGILARRPDLAPAGWPDAFVEPPAADPRLRALAELEAKFEASDANKAGLVEPLEAWLREHEEALPDAAPLARTLLGGARYHAKQWKGAYEMWRSVVARYPDHPARYRAEYNLVEVGAWPTLPTPDIVNAEPPDITDLGVIVPFPEARARHLEQVRTDPRYLHVRDGLPFVRIPAGTFTMGGSPAVQGRELPNRKVTLTRPFLVSAWPVTRRLWKLFRPEQFAGYRSDGLAAELPAVGLSWLDAEAFVKFLRERDGRPYRLLGEAEWEFAARGGLEGKPWPWGDEPLDETKANYIHPRPVPVACYPANGYGLFDMVGNNFEWTGEYYRADAFAQTPSEVVDPPGPTREESAQANGGDPWRTVRGAGWMGNEMSKLPVRNSWRLGWPERFKYGALGFRVALDLEE